jgi:hypothetical protein
MDKEGSGSAAIICCAMARAVSTPARAARAAREALRASAEAEVARMKCRRVGMFVHLL